MVTTYDTLGFWYEFNADKNPHIKWERHTFMSMLEPKELIPTLNLPSRPITSKQRTYFQLYYHLLFNYERIKKRTEIEWNEWQNYLIPPLSLSPSPSLPSNLTTTYRTRFRPKYYEPSPYYTNDKRIVNPLTTKTNHYTESELKEMYSKETWRSKSHFIILPFDLPTYREATFSHILQKEAFPNASRYPVPPSISRRMRDMPNIIDLKHWYRDMDYYRDNPKSNSATGFWDSADQMWPHRAKKLEALQREPDYEPDLSLPHKGWARLRVYNYQPRMWDVHSAKPYKRKYTLLEINLPKKREKRKYWKLSDYDIVRPELTSPSSHSHATSYSHLEFIMKILSTYTLPSQSRRIPNQFDMKFAYDNLRKKMNKLWLID